MSKFAIEQDTGYQYEPIPEGEFDTAEEAVKNMIGLEADLGWRDLRVVDDDGDVDEWGRSTEDDQREEMKAVSSLEELRDLISYWSEFSHDGSVPEWVFLAKLPTFGGDEPDDTFEVFSWDHERLLIGIDLRGGTIVSRRDWDTAVKKFGRMAFVELLLS